MNIKRVANQPTCMARVFLLSSGTVIPSKAGIQKRPLTSPGQGSRQSHGYLLVCCKGSVAILWAWRPLLRPASLSGNDVAPGASFHRPPPAVVQWQQKVRAREAKRPLTHVRSPRDNQAYRAPFVRRNRPRKPSTIKDGEKMYPAGGPIAWFGCRRSGKMSG